MSHPGAFIDRQKWHLERWLYADNWTKESYDLYTRLNSIGPVRNYMDYLLDRRADKEYLSRYGYDYSDIHDPRKLAQSSSGARYYGNIMSVSRNVEELYEPTRKANRPRVQDPFNLW